MQVLGGEGVAFGGLAFGDGEGVEHAVDVLHVGDVAADADNRGGIEGTEALYIGEAGEGAVGG